ncbi:hypothetical protein VIGAN_06022200 [Vigna angularis var. angularis]|uniref:Uncharacterized protein n=1 Tax=Vigna angularis var. angularis TaxID=157739 RepID=A0A0S3S8X5_PHAAN|nr:hypothetical protein VIGAN_06022200 [Vigna angularis var. angularis]
MEMGSWLFRISHQRPPNVSSRNLPWVQIGSLFQTPTVDLVQHSPSSSQGQTALILLKRIFGLQTRENQGVASMSFS